MGKCREVETVRKMWRFKQTGQIRRKGELEGGSE